MKLKALETLERKYTGTLKQSKRVASIERIVQAQIDAMRRRRQLQVTGTGRQHWTICRKDLP